MKKFFLAAILMVALTTTSMAGDNKALFNNLKSAAKSATQIKRTETGDYKEAIFEYNGKTVTAFYDGESDNLVGFSIPIGVEDLPAGTMEDVQKKYNGWEITDKILFTTSHRSADYYLQLRKGDINIALFVTRKGKVHFLRTMH